MNYRFQDFEFNSQQRLLIRNGEVYSLNEKAALLLSLLLEDTRKIHSKGDILDYVWADRVVTDQVVFQNISVLRAIFGDDAIKIFSKKGYQWQVPLKEVKPLSTEPIVVEQEQHLDRGASAPASTAQRVTKTARSPFSARTFIQTVIVVLFLALGGWWMWPNSGPLEHVDISQSSAASATGFYRVTTENQQINLLPTTSTLKVQQFFDSPYSSWQQLTHGQGQHWIVATKTYQLGARLAVRFHIQGAARGWQDYLVVDDGQQGLQRLTGFIESLRSSDYFSMHNDHRAWLSLEQLNHQQDALLNTLIERQKVILLYQLNEHVKADQVAQQALKTTSSPLHRGLLLLEKARNRMFLNQWDGVRQELTEANQLFANLGMTHLESFGLMEMAWMHFVDSTFRQGIEVLNLAATKARTSDEPLLEVTAHLRQAFLASKANLPELMHAQTDLAKELITLHQLGEEHALLVHYNQAWSMGKQAQALPHYQRILSMEFAPQYSLYFYSAAKITGEIYIQQKHWSAALATVRPWQRLSFQRLLEAKVAIAQSDSKLGVTKAKQAFEYAKLHHHKVDTLDAALIVLQYHPSEESELAPYRAHLNQHATVWWREINADALSKVLH